MTLLLYKISEKGGNKMSNTENIKTVDMTAKFSNFEVINSEFTRCRCNVMYIGRNRNYSDITEKALNNFIQRKGYANVPIVAHLIKNEDGTYRVGGHDEKVIISDEGFEVINECIPYGVIPEDCNPSMDWITEKSGEKHQYFSVDIILWTHRYPIMEAAYGQDIYFNQSMELTFSKYHIDETDSRYIVVDDFNMSALCLLNLADGKDGDKNPNIEPCFESSRVKKFALNETEFKKNYDLLLDNLKKLSNDNITKNYKKEEILMDFTKVADALAQYKIADTDNAKYGLLTVSDTSIGVLDLEDFSVYTIDCTENEGEIVMDMENKVKCALSVKDYVEGESFDLAGMVKTVKSDYETELTKVYQAEYDSKITKLTQAYSELKEQFEKVNSELDVFKEADEARKVAAHKAEIDTVISQYEKKIGRLPEFLCYRAKLDYSKSVEDVTNELTIMVGRVTMDKNGKSTFSYSPVTAEVSNKQSNNYADGRYGNLLNKFSNMD